MPRDPTIRDDMADAAVALAAARERLDRALDAAGEAPAGGQLRDIRDEIAALLRRLAALEAPPAPQAIDFQEVADADRRRRVRVKANKLIVAPDADTGPPLPDVVDEAVVALREVTPTAPREPLRLAAPMEPVEELHAEPVPERGIDVARPERPPSLVERLGALRAGLDDVHAAPMPAASRFVGVSAKDAQARLARLEAELERLTMRLPPVPDEVAEAEADAATVPLAAAEPMAAFEPGPPREDLFTAAARGEAEVTIVLRAPHPEPGQPEASRRTSVPVPSPHTRTITPLPYAAPSVKEAHVEIVGGRRTSQNAAKSAATSDRGGWLSRRLRGRDD